MTCYSAVMRSAEAVSQRGGVGVRFSVAISWPVRGQTDRLRVMGDSHAVRVRVRSRRWCPKRSRGICSTEYPRRFAGGTPTRPGREQLAVGPNDSGGPGPARILRAQSVGYHRPDMPRRGMHSIGGQRHHAGDVLSSPSAATHYAQGRGLRHWHNIVVAFPPVMSASEQDRYWSAIVEIFP